MIPLVNQDGYLPVGIYDCTMDEAAERFGGFQNSDRRPQLWAKLVEFVREVALWDFIENVLVDGSFVTATPEPNDIDLVLVVTADHDLAEDLQPVAYNVLFQAAG